MPLFCLAAMASEESGQTSKPPVRKTARSLAENRDMSMKDETENLIVLGMFLGGTIATFFGIFMWQGGWAALAAIGVLAALLAMSQSIVVATSAGARSIAKKIVRANLPQTITGHSADKCPVIDRDFEAHKQAA
jgi:hypothetical protein